MNCTICRGLKLANGTFKGTKTGTASSTAINQISAKHSMKILTFLHYLTIAWNQFHFYLLTEDEEAEADSHQKAPPILNVGTDPVLVMEKDINFL